MREAEKGYRERKQKASKDLAASKKSN